MHKNLPTVEGLQTRFIISLTAEDGTDTTLAGFVRVGGEPLPMIADGETELIAPATAAGDYLYEIRAGGSVVLWGHLCARRSAFPAGEEAAAIEVTATLSGETAVAVSITLNEGPQGPKGEKGDTGDTGPQGPQGPPGDAGASVPTEQLLAPSVGLDSFAAGPGAVAYCADSLAVGLGAVVGATYASQSKTATATRQSTDATSETNTTDTSYSSNSVAVGLHAQASGYRSTAYGNFAMADGDYCTANGYGAKAIDTYSTATGYGAKAIGNTCTATGYGAYAQWSHCTATGTSASAYGTYSTAIGSSASSVSFATAIGNGATASGSSSTAIGRNAVVGSKGVSSVALGAGAYVNDAGCVALNAGGASGNGGTGYSTQLYLITKGSSLATTYLGGEAGLGYIVYDHMAGSIVARGVIPLASICTEHTSDFEPTGYSGIQDY